MFVSRKKTIILMLMMFSVIATSLPKPASAAEAQTWKETALVLSSTDKACANLSNKYQMVVGQPSGTFIYNMRQQGSSKLLSPVKVETCTSKIGYGYKAPVVDREPLPQAYSFTVEQPEGTPINHLPGYVNNNYPDVYSLEFDRKTLTDGRLWYSPDSGKTWEERGQEMGGKIVDYAASYTDPKVVYAVVSLASSNAEKNDYNVYSSADTGKTWTKGAKVEVGRGSFGAFASLLTLEGANTQTVVLSTGSPGAAIGFDTVYSLSTDGGKTFNKVGETFRPAGASTDLFVTPKGILLLKKDFDGSCLFTYLNDKGQLGQKLSLPFICKNTETRAEFGISMQQNPANPSVLILIQVDQDEHTVLWISEDAGDTWRQFTKSFNGVPFNIVTFAGNSPAIALVGQYNATKKVLLLDERNKTAAAVPNNRPGNLYFPETGHNLTGAFKTYWQQNGGLAQFGYPTTEVMSELNPSDGKVYDVQYFERNRFEYHPELKGTKFEVLLGLLGNQLTESRRSETPFKPIDVRAALLSPDDRFFTETGHTLKAEFKKYWEANGGLAINGYPISEPFQEVNPDNGKTYLVQYFERSRFELHPENKGTKYEVLLGLLGNTLLRQKDWL